MDEIYVTEQGDTWDMISYKVYGNSKYINVLMQHNLELLDTFIFSAGTELYMPQLTEQESEDIPEWR